MVQKQVFFRILNQGQAESTSNYVCSPLGYSTILAILAEGAKGRTRDEILQALEQPTKNVQDMRNTYRSVLSDFAGNDSVVAPQFKTWFYIYKPNVAIEEFKQTLIKDYLVEVKDIEKFDYDFGTMHSQQDNYIPTSNSQDILDFDDFNQNKPIDETEGFDTTVRDAIADYDQIDKDEKSKVSKFDKEIDDKQYVEKSEIPVTEIINEEDTTLNSILNENESGPEKFVLPIRKFIDDSMEIMEAQENKNFANGFGRAQPLHLLGDVTSALSGNAIMGRKSDAKELESKMLLFNGLYFRGDWAQKFEMVDELKSFDSVKGKQDAKFITTNGLFKYIEIPSKNLIALEIPYKNDRYAFLIVMPTTLSDMKQHCKQSNYNNLNEIVGQMELSNINLFMPRFRYECTSRAEKALGKLGVTTLFTSKADLSGITEDSKGFQIEELVQHVAVRIDEASSSESVLSAGNVHGRNNGKPTEVLINKPFLFYVRDTVNDVILSAGKIMEIPKDEELDIAFSI
ncbi:serpin I2 [Chironomus tepperi]|uniref:serpin I2 n=1 Tax=Chironomus tepperi TaxID=113505 RepID=UPI00391F302C